MAKANFEDNDNANIDEIVKYRKQQAAKPAPVDKPKPKPNYEDNDDANIDEIVKYRNQQADKPIGQKKGGPVKCMASGGLTSRGDGIAQRGKTKCKYR